MVDAKAAFQAVIAAIAPYGIVTVATDQRIADFGTAKNDMVSSSVAEIIVDAVTVRVLANDHWADCLQDHIGVDRISHALRALVQFQYVVWCQEQ